MRWLRLVGSYYWSPLKKSPLKETIFCTRDLMAAIMIKICWQWSGTARVSSIWAFSDDVGYSAPKKEKLENVKQIKELHVLMCRP